MASNGAPLGDADTKTSLEKIKRQLASSSGRHLLQGPLLKRSETLRKWNERWVILDPTTGKMEYKVRRNEPTVKGTMIFDANSTITISPVNFQGLPKYDGCCFYIGTPQRKDYFLCAETPAATRAWVSTLQATQLVLRAHKEAVNTLSGNGSTKLGTVATVVAAANSTAMEASKEIEAAMQISMRNALGVMLNKTPDLPMDDLSIMKETLRVKDEELQNLARDLRARDSTIKEIAEKLSETAEAAEAAASAAYTMDEQRRIACAEVERLTRDSEKQFVSSKQKIKELEEKALNLSREKDQLIKERDSAIQEAHLWRSELAKARERAVILEGAVVRAEEKVRVTEADAEARIKEAMEKESAAAKEKQELLSYINALQEQLKRQQIGTREVFAEKTDPCSSLGGDLPLTKHVDPSQENVDKACLSVSKATSVPAESDLHSIRESEWSDIQTTEARIADVREVGQDAEGHSLDIPVVNFPVNDHQEHGSSDQP
ncbi:Pleckstrin homology domain-containing protein [Perilla frutescens var. hirtella]|uniref:Pleckstrin homology domain-containing protein n=1 Tax=Perilla frutescens var. hirtella TaxID=608512 RepID=A0AAD4JP06_PERFH|nr:Pleckstrin homology domain-containing protein [Perilla frutescens var. hirtella]